MSVGRIVFCSSGSGSAVGRADALAEGAVHLS